VRPAVLRYGAQVRPGRQVPRTPHEPQIGLAAASTSAPGAMPAIAIIATPVHDLAMIRPRAAAEMPPLHLSAP